MAPIRVTIGFDAGFGVQSGYGLAGLLDNTVMRDAEGLPYIPGTTLKGVVREACTEIALLKGYKPLARVVDEVNAILKQGKDPHDPKNYNPVTRIFGTPLIPAAFEFRSAYLTDGPKERDLQESLRDRIVWNEAHTSISLATGTALEQHLFSSEVVAHDVCHRNYTFGFDIEPDPDLTDEKLISLLFCGIRLVDHIGSGKTRGKGLVKMEIAMPYEEKDMEEWAEITFK